MPATSAVPELDFASRVDRGLVRETNQDVARVLPALGLALVADGMGGHARGDVASRLAADEAVAAFEAMDRSASAEARADRMRHAFVRANRRMCAPAGTTDPQGKMGTTLVTLAFARGDVVVGNVGDSRCYRLRDRSLERLTRDHSYAAELERAGITRTPEGREAAARWAHVLTRSLNGTPGIQPDVSVFDVAPGDVYLLCSDGLWGCVDDDAIGDTLAAARDADEACERLVSAAMAGGGFDNIGVAVARVLARDGDAPASRP